MHGCVTKTSLDISPSPGALLHCWRIFEADPMRPMLLADTTPFVSAQHFLNAVGSSIVPFLAHADGEPAALVGAQQQVGGEGRSGSGHIYLGGMQKHYRE